MQKTSEVDGSIKVSLAPTKILNINWLSSQQKIISVLYFFPALCELFDKADTGGDGTISIQEYIAMCDEYGVELTEEHLEGVRAIANDDGEVE